MNLTGIICARGGMVIGDFLRGAVSKEKLIIEKLCIISKYIR